MSWRNALVEDKLLSVQLISPSHETEADMLCCFLFFSIVHASIIAPEKKSFEIRVPFIPKLYQ